MKLTEAECPWTQLLLLTLISHLKDHIDRCETFSSAMALSSHKTTTEKLTSLQIHLNFKVKKPQGFSLRYLLYFVLQYVEECNVQWAVWQTYLQLIWIWLNQYSKGIPLGKQADKRAWQYAVLCNMLWIC